MKIKKTLRTMGGNARLVGGVGKEMLKRALMPGYADKKIMGSSFLKRKKK